MKLAKVINRFILVSLSLTSIFLSITGCDNNKKKKIENSIPIEINKIDEPIIYPEFSSAFVSQHWHQTKKRVIVLFGEDFSDSVTSNNYLYVLQDRFGLDSEGGLISPIIYPKDLKHGTSSYVNDMVEAIRNNYTETEVIGLIFLGAPENSYKVIENLGSRMYYPVISIFPKDESIPMEATCELVIDKSSRTTETRISNDKNTLLNLAPEILVNTIEYLKILNEMRITFSDKVNETDSIGYVIKNSFPNDSKTIVQHVARMLKGHTFSNYVDRDTGLPSFNHFVID